MNTDWNAFFNALLVFVLGVLGWIATKRGYSQAEPKTASKTGNGVLTTTTIADSADMMGVKQLTGEITGLAIAMHDNAKATAQVADATVKAKEAIDDLREQVKELRQVMAQRH